MSKIPVVARNNIANYIYTSKMEPWQIYFNLLSDLNSVSKTSWGIEHSNDKYFRGRFTINKDLIRVIPKNQQELYFPALLLPYRDKDEMIMPYFHWEVLHNIAIPEIEELYLIGWKGSEELFNRKLQQANRLKKIIIVNPDAETVKANLGKHIDLSKYTIEIVSTFEDFVLKHLDNYLIQG
jgi:hypothetical protein